MKVRVIPIVIGALGTVMENLEKRGRVEPIQTTELVGWLVGCYGISTFCSLFNAKSIIIKIITSILNNLV